MALWSGHRFVLHVHDLFAQEEAAHSTTTMANGHGPDKWPYVQTLGKGMIEDKEI
jgi:hypothetical protein